MVDPKKSVHIRLKNLAHYISSDHYSLLKFSNRALLYWFRILDYVLWTDQIHRYQAKDKSSPWDIFNLNKSEKRNEHDAHKD